MDECPLLEEWTKQILLVVFLFQKWTRIVMLHSIAIHINLP